MLIYICLVALNRQYAQSSLQLQIELARTAWWLRIPGLPRNFRATERPDSQEPPARNKSLMERTRSMRMSARTILLVALVAALSGCVTTTTSQTFRRNPDSVVEAAFIAADADFSQYDRLTGAEMGIFFPTASAIPDEDLDRIRAIFRSTFLAELADYEVVDQTGRGIMLVDASLIDLRGATYADIPSLRREVRDIATPGSLVFLMELKDSRTGRVLARAADTSRNPNIGSDQLDASEWAAVEAAAGHWASLFRQFLDQNLGE